MIVWLNGPFGGGKTTVARRLAQAVPSLALFDTEQIGFMLAPVLSARIPVEDYQDWPSWRSLVSATVTALHRELRRVEVDLLVPQSILDHAYWSEVMSDLGAADVPVRAFTLDVVEAELVRRIDNDFNEHGAHSWRHERRGDFFAARSWMRSATEFVNTTDVSPDEVADSIRKSLDVHQSSPGHDRRGTGGTR